jgi:type IV pilus assembly protein PilF
MKRQNWGAVVCCAFLAGCVTTMSGDRAVEADKAEVAALNLDLGISYLRQGNLEQAMLKLNKSIADEPNNPTAHRALALVYERLDDLEGAEKEYRTAVKLAPDDPDALNELAIFTCRHGDTREALRYFDRAIAIPRNQGRYIIYANAGTCAKETDLDLAENYLRRSLAENSSFPDALYQMADVSYRLESFLPARAFIERRMAAAPADPAALWLGYRIELKMKSRQGADVFARQLLREFPESVEARMLLEGRRNGQRS